MMVSPTAAAAAAGRRLRHRPGLRRPVQLRRARAAGPHRAGALRRLLERRRDQLRPGDLTCRSRTPPCASPTCESGDLDMIERMAADRSAPRSSADAEPAAGGGDARSATRASPSTSPTASARKNPLGQDTRVRQALRPRDRPRRDQPGGLRGRVRPGQPAGARRPRPGTTQAIPVPAARRRGRQGAAGRGRPRDGVSRRDAGRQQPRADAGRAGHPGDGCRGRHRRRRSPRKEFATAPRRPGPPATSTPARSAGPAVSIPMATSTPF